MVVYVSIFVLRKRRSDTEKTRRLIDSMLKNYAQNLGIEVDAASIQWPVKHPSFAALIWDMFEIPEQKSIWTSNDHSVNCGPVLRRSLPTTSLSNVTQPRQQSIIMRSGGLMQQEVAGRAKGRLVSNGNETADE